MAFHLHVIVTGIPDGTGSKDPSAPSVQQSQGVGIPSAVAAELDELLPETGENGTTTRLTVLQGETAFLPCKAYSLGQRTVSCKTKQLSYNSLRLL